MDQIKQQLAVVRKHGFWISTFLVALVAVAVWYMATGTLQAESEKQISDLKAANASMDTIRSSLSEHPNSQSHVLTEQMVDKQNAAVLAAWKRQYERQQNILVWPEESLDNKFIERVKDFFPIESSFPEFPVPPEKEIESRYLEAYREYIGDVLPAKAAMVGAEWTADFSASPMSAMMGMGSSSAGMEMGSEAMMQSSMDGGSSAMGMTPFGPAPERGPLVQWKTTSQEEVLADLFPWRGSRPTTLEVLYSQENLWVLTQLLQIIADTNGDITQPFQAKIHEIERIGIGRSAKRAIGEISAVTAGGSAGGDGTLGMGMGMGMDSDSMMMDSSGGGAAMDTSSMEMGMGMGMGSTTFSADPLASRYVDINYEPIEADRVRAAMAPDNRSPEDAFLTVAKRLPVVLRVKMDQREIPRLVAACGNAALMVEVRQIRINPATGGGSGMGMGMSMGMGSSEMGSSSEMGMSMGMDSSMEMGMGMGMGDGAQMGQGQTRSYPMDVPVEIYGIIQIYNPPAMEKLGVDQVDSTTVVEGQAMGDQPAVEPTADATPRVQPAPEATATPDTTTPPGVTTPPAAGPAVTTPPAAGPAVTTPPAAGPAVTTPPAAPPAAAVAPATTTPATTTPAASPPGGGAAGTNPAGNTTP